ncbi:MAG TPA: ABC transporter substrate-binding protein [Thermoanaerobaculia bacterium]|nr:ABC transporter substrate-binding protein [Thermoanaerobaculia bacterium]
MSSKSSAWRRRWVAVGFAAAAAASCRRLPERTRVLTIALPYEVTTLDPHAAFTVSNLAVLMNVYEPLAAFDADMRLVPRLARSWENPDPETWIFHLRPGVRFHGGKSFSAADVVYSFERLRKRTDFEMSGFLVSIDRVDAVDPATVRVRTRTPSPILLNKLASVAIVPDGATDAGLANGADGTGPFRLRRFHAETVELLRNERYWGARPFASEAVYRLGQSADRALGLVRERSAGLALCNTRAIGGPGASYRVLRAPDVFVKHLGFDLGSESVGGGPNPFRDIRVRRAIDLAIDREALVAALPAPAVPARQLTPAFIFGYDPALPARPPDRAEAVRLLAAAGFPNGFEIGLDVRRLFEPAAREVARQLALVGIRARVWVHSDLEMASSDARRSLAFFLDRFGCTSGDISDVLDDVIHTAEPERHFGLYNTVGYSNRDIDAMIEESDATVEPTLRRDRLHRIVEAVSRDLVIVPLYVDEDVYAVDRSFRWRPRDDGMVLAAEVRRADGTAEPQ